MKYFILKIFIRKDVLFSVEVFYENHVLAPSEF